MVACECIDVHKRRRVVLTGGPGASKTALPDLIRQAFEGLAGKPRARCSVAVSQGRTTRPVDVRRSEPSSTSSASWKSLETATIRRLFCVIVERSTGWRIGQGFRRSSGRLWARPSRPSSVGTTPSSICIRPGRSTAATTRIRCGQSQPAPRPTLTPESCGPTNDIPDGSLSSRSPNSLTRPHGRSISSRRAARVLSAARQSRASRPSGRVSRAGGRPTSDGLRRHHHASRTTSRIRKATRH